MKNEVRSSDTVSAVRTELIRIAASLVTGEHLPSCFDEGNFYKMLGDLS